MDTNKNKYEEYTVYGDSDFSWQSKCLDSIKDEKNVILSSPTGSGKTRVFLEWAKNKKNKPIIITAPIKALSNQRYRELLEEGYVVGLETGDIKDVPENCDFICCTQEIYTNKYVEEEDVTLIMDEFHYIFENHMRARTYIDALHKSKADNILLCSATLGDIDELTKYVKKVSGRDFYTYENNDRSTSLFFEGDIDFEEIKNSLIVTFSMRNIEWTLNGLNESREIQDEEKIKKIEQLAEMDKIKDAGILQFAKKGVAGYHGALLPKEKLFIEKCFEQGLIDTVVGTDALALGVNFPVENVIFAQLAKYYQGPISKNLFDQLAGRAGRKGYFDEGHVYYCSDLANTFESYEYDTVKLFDNILEQENENISIELTPNIKEILLEQTTIQEEAEFIAKFSTKELDVEEISKDIANTIKYIKEDAFGEVVNDLVCVSLQDEYEEIYKQEVAGTLDESYVKKIEEEKERRTQVLFEKQKEYLENISRVYFEEYTPEINCELFINILSDVDRDGILSKFSGNKGFNSKLQLRKYIQALPKKYRKGLTKINDEIREIDETAIDGFRGAVSVDNVVEQLEREGKLTGENIETVLKVEEDKIQDDTCGNEKERG